MMMKIQGDQYFIMIFIQVMIMNLPTNVYVLRGWESQNINEVMRAIKGNHRRLTIGSFNLGKGLIDGENWGTYKFTEIKEKIKREKADIFSLIETNLHGQNSRIIRANPITANEIRAQLDILGYDLI